MMLKEVKQTVIVCERYNPPKGFTKYRLYNRDLGCYISGYDDYNTAVEHANKENIRMSKYKMVFDIE